MFNFTFSPKLDIRQGLAVVGVLMTVLVVTITSVVLVINNRLALDI